MMLDVCDMFCNFTSASVQLKPHMQTCHEMCGCVGWECVQLNKRMAARTYMYAYVLQMGGYIIVNLSDNVLCRSAQRI